jgi:hypothetical protein
VSIPALPPIPLRDELHSSALVNRLLSKVLVASKAELQLAIDFSNWFCNSNIVISVKIFNN